MPSTKREVRPRSRRATATGPSARDQRRAAAREAADAQRAQKLHNIAERRAKAAKMTKAQFIAEIVKGKYPPITAEDIAREPTPE